MAEIETLRDLLIDELRDLYSAEQQWVKALPRMIAAATHHELKYGFQLHLRQTVSHVLRLERAFEVLKERGKDKTCKAMNGLIAESEAAVELDAPEVIRDACLIGAAQRVEHYQIAVYGTARAFAEALREAEMMRLLQETLDEKLEADRNFSALCATINEQAIGREDTMPRQVGVSF